MKKLKDFLDKQSQFKDYYRDGMEVQILGVDKDRERCDLRIDSAIRAKQFNTKYLDNATRIGMSGWNWKEKKSYWVAFDFDSSIGHAKGLTDVQLKEILENTKRLSWATVRYSTSGNGLHIYIIFDTPPAVDNRKEHRLLAEATLGQLSALVGFNYKDVLDCTGGIFWVWTNDPRPKSFQVIQTARQKFSAIPPDWKENKIRNNVRGFATNIKHIDLTDDHKQLLYWFDKNPAQWWWDPELNMLVCHTFNLKQAHSKLNLKGLFDTNSTGKDCPNDQNCFAFPIKNGAWIVRRHGKEVSEHSLWRTDKSGWRFCLYNRFPNLEDVCRYYSGQTNSKGEYVFNGVDGHRLINKLSREPFTFPKEFESRQLKIKELKGAKISLFVERLNGEPDVEGWISDGKKYECVVDILKEEKEISAPDDFLRHAVSEEEHGGCIGSGWYVKIKDKWVEEKNTEARLACIGKGIDQKYLQELMGQCVLNPWYIVNKPFMGEYPGGREWNKASAQLAFIPEIGEFPTWELLLNHVGKSLDEPVKENIWCTFNEIRTGGDYLKYWVASLLQYPTEPLPYLFFFGGQNVGKSIFHEALNLIIRNGVMRANTAITSMQGFNKEIAGSVVCVVEEVNLSKVARAYERIKDWTTAKKISIHEKGKTPFVLDNTTHWIHCANNISYCPVSIGDTRIIMCKVYHPENPIPKYKLLESLAHEAPAFLYECLNIQIAPAVDRLRIPLIETNVKKQEALSQAEEPIVFFHMNTTECPGARILFKEFVDKFTMNSNSPSEWTSQKVARSMADETITKGLMEGNKVYIGNRRWKEAEEEYYDYALVEVDGKLKKINL